MKRYLLVAKRELFVTIRRPTYILMILGMPLLIGGIWGIAILTAVVSVSKTTPRLVAVTDSSGVLNQSILHELEKEALDRDVLDETLQTALDEKLSNLSSSTMALTHEVFSGFRGAVSLLTMTDADSAKEATRRGELDAALIVSGDYLETGKVYVYSLSKSFLEDTRGPAEQLLEEALVKSLLEDYGLDPKVEERVLAPMWVDAYEVVVAGEDFQESSEASEFGKFILPYGFALLLMMSIFMGGGFLLQGVAEEKENRVIEMLLSSVTTDDLILGKVLGLGTAGLIQVFVWLSMAFALLTVASQSWSGFEVPIGLFILCFCYFLVGYLMNASLMGGVGSLGNTVKESQQLSMWFTMPAVIPLIVMMAILNEPNGVLARVFSYIPITSPITMMLRLPSQQVPWWEIPLTFLVLILFTWFALKLGAKLFRLGSLMYGKRPNLPEIWKWLWQT